MSSWQWCQHAFFTRHIIKITHKDCEIALTSLATCNQTYCRHFSVGVFRFFPNKHAGINSKKMCPYLRTYLWDKIKITLRSQEKQMTRHFMNHRYFDNGQNPNIPYLNEPHAWKKNGWMFNISFENQWIVLDFSTCMHSVVNILAFTAEVPNKALHLQNAYCDYMWCNQAKWVWSRKKYDLCFFGILY